MNCLNLRERFGRQYRIKFDPVYDSKNRPTASRDPWMMQIPCQRGVIYPHGGTWLAVEVDGRPRTARRLQESGVCVLDQDGDHEKTFLFDVAHIAVVAAIVKPRRRRQVSEAERQRLASIGFQQTPQPERLQQPVSRSETLV